jgi:hypothetical protein
MSTDMNHFAIMCVQFTLTVKFMASVMDIKMVMNSESANCKRDGHDLFNLLFLQSLIPISNKTHDWDSGIGFTDLPNQIKHIMTLLRKFLRGKLKRENHTCINK